MNTYRGRDRDFAVYMPGGAVDAYATDAAALDALRLAAPGDIAGPLKQKAKRQDDRRAFIDSNRIAKAAARKAKRNRKADAKRHRNRKVRH